MAPCNRRCSLCPFKNPELPDRVLRATYFAAIYLKAAVPGWHPHLDCMINCVAKMRDISELFNCCDDYKRLKAGKVLDTRCQTPYARPLKQSARVLGLLSSLITPLGVFGDWGLVPLGRYGQMAGVASRALSATGHLATVGWLLIDLQSRGCPKTTSKTVDALSECSYMLLELFMERATVEVQAGIGVATGGWGVWKNVRPKSFGG